APVVAGQDELADSEFVEHRDHVRGQGPLLVRRPVAVAIAVAQTAQVRSDHAQGGGQVHRDLVPAPGALRPTVQEDERRTVVVAGGAVRESPPDGFYKGRIGERRPARHRRSPSPASMPAWRPSRVRRPDGSVVASPMWNPLWQRKGNQSIRNDVPKTSSECG